MEALGVTDHRFLGGPGRYRDTGMMGTAANDRPDCFWQADLDEAAALLVAVIREVRPQVVVTYDENGGYGHPDHIQAHRVTMRGRRARRRPGVRAGAGEPWQVAKLYWTAIPKSVAARAASPAARRPATPPSSRASTRADDLPFGVPDDQVTTAVDATDHVDAKIAAMRAHATQIAVDGPFFALSNNLGQRGVGHRALRAGPRRAGPGATPTAGRPTCSPASTEGPVTPGDGGRAVGAERVTGAAAYG